MVRARGPILFHGTGKARPPGSEDVAWGRIGGDGGCVLDGVRRTGLAKVSAQNRRHLDWDGCFNVRDLGGLRTRDGGTTQWRSVIRADALDGLTAAGWFGLSEYGVRTVIDLPNDAERGPDLAPRPPEVKTSGDRRVSR
jgi:hypothetical protein